MLSPKVTERLLHICGDLSVSASPSHLPWEGRPWGTHSNGFPYEGKALVLKKQKIFPQKGAARQIQAAPSIYRKNSKAAAIKFDSYVSGGAYQNAHEVTPEWNDA